jgi:hypothetical protein
MRNERKNHESVTPLGIYGLAGILIFIGTGVILKQFYWRNLSFGGAQESLLILGTTRLFLLDLGGPYQIAACSEESRGTKSNQLKSISQVSVSGDYAMFGFFRE